MVEIYEDKRGEWRWRYRASNGLITCDGAEGYATKSNAKRAAKRAGIALALARTKCLTHPWPLNGDH